MSGARTPSLQARLSLVLTVLIAVLMSAGAAVWMRETRQAIHEEVEAATRVAQQWLVVVLAEQRDGDAEARARLLSRLAAVGRIRANRLEVFGVGGERLYVSPESPYKAGRDAPAWFAQHVAPELGARRLDAGALEVVLTPDTSRAVLDAWDHLVAALGWACALLLALWLATRVAIRRALAPLQQIHVALEHGARGRFDQRLPEYATRELALLARSYNRLADRLDESRATNARLEADQSLARTIQARLEQERRAIARELHDELGQSITAVRSIAGAILQRSAEQPGIHGSAQAILAMTGHMQDGVHAILQRLRRDAPAARERIEDTLQAYCALWASHHEGIALRCQIEPLGEARDEPLDDGVGLALLRVLQESLTNVARHARARSVEVRVGLRREGGGRDGQAEIEVEVRDDGRGLGAQPTPGRHGLAGMRERLAELHGRLELHSPPTGGLCVRARLPQALRQPLPVTQ